MAQEIATQDLPKHGPTGLILPLSKSLGSQDLAQHRAMVAVELEVLAKKFDRFGWERDRGSMAHDRMITDWMDALQDFPLTEIQAACRQAVKDSGKMPNEGAILRIIGKARAEQVKAYKASLPAPAEPQRERLSPERSAEIMRDVGFRPKKFGGAA